jgi:hypothetical protein
VAEAVLSWLRPLGQDDGLHHHSGRRGQGRLPEVGHAGHSFRRFPDAAPARRAVRDRAARGRARLTRSGRAITSLSTTRSMSR